MEKEYPILWNNKEECCGCSACALICSQNAIVMEEDMEGFEYPIIEKEKCIKCYQCVKVCLYKQNNK